MGWRGRLVGWVFLLFRDPAALTRCCLSPQRLCVQLACAAPLPTDTHCRVRPDDPGSLAASGAEVRGRDRIAPSSSSGRTRQWLSLRCSLCVFLPSCLSVCLLSWTHLRYALLQTHLRHPGPKCDTLKAHLRHSAPTWVASGTRASLQTLLRYPDRGTPPASLKTLKAHLSYPGPNPIHPHPDAPRRVTSL